MTRTGRNLDEHMAQGAPGKVALCSFLRHLPPDSALYRELHPDDDGLWLWTTTAKTNAILADLFDAYAMTHARKGRRPKPYPRPGDARGKSIGKGAIPIRDFESWWNGVSR